MNDLKKEEIGLIVGARYSGCYCYCHENVVWIYIGISDPDPGFDMTLEENCQQACESRGAKESRCLARLNNSRANYMGCPVISSKIFYKQNRILSHQVHHLRDANNANYQ